MSLVVQIAGVALPVRTSAGLARRLKSRLGPFCQTVEGQEFPGCPTLVTDSGQRPPDTNPTFTREDLQLWINQETRTMWVRPASSHDWEHVTERAIRFAYASWLPNSQALLLHAAAILYGDKAIAFAGPSGVGKSTVARRFPPEALLTDDTVALRRVEGTWWAHATPFVNLPTRPPLVRGLKLERVFVLERSDHEEVVSLTKTQRVRDVTGNLVMPVPGTDLDALAGLADDLALSVPVHRLRRTVNAPLPFGPREPSRVAQT